jgi:hypothetical protein
MENLTKTEKSDRKTTPRHSAMRTYATFSIIMLSAAASYCYAGAVKLLSLPGVGKTSVAMLSIITSIIIVITMLYHKVSWTPELSLTSKEKMTGKLK